MENIGIDTGHGLVKGIGASGRILFPAMLAPAPQGLELGNFARQNVMEIQLDGGEKERCLYGAEAIRTGHPVFAARKSADHDTHILTWIAAAQLVPAGFSTLSLAVGVPLSWWSREREPLARALTKNLSVGDRYLHIQEVSVLPQGIGALLSALDHPKDGYFALVDIGFRTTDYLVARLSGGAPKVLPDLSGTLELGMHHAYAAASQAMEKAYAVAYSPAAIMAAANGHEELMAYGQIIELPEFLGTPYQALAESIARQLESAWSSILSELRGVVLSGGGGLVLDEIFTMPHSLAADPQWANVSGFLGSLERSAV